ncbi:MAG TPA: ATPase, T2SS/T4P/T4SS family [Fimbriimonadaceae bacterium]|nr:ATPase, T2SS/T4P/T4SS family [Fimbriimonadaceae bacterium]
MPKRLLGEILVEQRLMTTAQLEECLQTQRSTGEPLGTIIVRRKIVTAHKMLQVLAAQKGVSPWFLDKDKPATDALDLVPIGLCRRYQALPVAVKAKLLVVAMRNPADLDAIDALRNISRLRVEPALADETLLAKAIEDLASSGTSSVATPDDDLGLFVGKAMVELERNKTKVETAKPLTEADTRPVIGLINELINQAFKRRATDIHLEPREDRVDVRLRVDGQMLEVKSIPIDLQRMVAARIKIMAELDVVEHRLPQDGRITYEVEGKSIDLRVSVLPVQFGQRIVLRILDRTVPLRRLGELGLSRTNADIFRRMIQRPYGLVLVTGPTGSGKTTTLYAALNELKSPTTNIMTCEDPIEYSIDGINQSQVRDKVGLTFAAQLRAMLRQDPDVVLVGEIRDQETAETAIRASLTGHLVLSTLHCNDAASAIPRLLDMGVDPFMLSTSLVGVCAQRLVRQLCPHCRTLGVPDAKSADALEIFGLNQAETWLAQGCAECSSTGYLGRTAVHEMLPVPDEIATLIANHAPVEQIREAAKPWGFRALQQDALDRVSAGLTTVIEARRVIAFADFKRTDESPTLRLAA